MEHNITCFVSVVMSSISHSTVDCNSKMFRPRRKVLVMFKSFRYTSLKHCTIAIYCAMWNAQHHYCHLKLLPWASTASLSAKLAPNMSLCGLWPSHPLLVYPLSLPQIEKLKAELSQLKASNTTQTAEALAGRDQKDVVRECIKST